MRKKFRLTGFSVNELLACVLAVCIFAFVLMVSAIGALQISKRQFEAEANNIAAVLRSGIGVADGVITSLHASGYADNQQLSTQLTNVLSNYEYVSALGRFEAVTADELSAYNARAMPNEDLSGVWSYDEDLAVNRITQSAADNTLLPLSVYKSRFDSKNKTDLTGFDLASVPATRSSVFGSGASAQTVITSVPAVWRRPGELLILRPSHDERSVHQGYMLELDLDKMAMSAGVEISKYGIDLRMFSEQGEFATDIPQQSIYQQSALTTSDLKFQNWIAENRWLKSFAVGDKTLLLNISGSTGLSAGLLFWSALVGAIVSLMFLTMAQLAKKRRHAQKLQKLESEKLFRARHRAAVTLASIDDGVLTTDANYGILSANEAAEKLLGCDESRMQGQSIDSVVIHSEDNGNLVLYAADGASRYISKKESLLKDDKGEISGHVMVLRDVSVEHTLTEELRHKVNHDALTGLSNRLYFENQIQQLFEAEVYPEDGHVLCFIDLDRFKEVNDTCGHDAGDELLKRIATAFKGNVRENDLVARLGGDEFGIVLRTCSRASASQVTSRIQEYFQSFFFEYDGHIFPVRCSIGYVHFHPESSDVDDVIKSADAACFDAKHSGRNSVCERLVGDSEKKSDQNSQWLSRLKFALENDGFDLHVQSIISLFDDQKTSHEVLLRLVEGDSIINAAAFMKSAVRYELAESIDRWVVKTTLSLMSQLQSQYAEDSFTINLSSQTVESADFIDFVSEQMHASCVDPAKLCFDVKESDLLGNAAVSEEFCRALRSLGCQVALDDFGALMSSFSLLKSLPITALKLDGSLIGNLGCDHVSGSVYEADYALVKAIQSFASSMGLATIAEQVENPKCVAMMREMGIDYAQGAAISPVQSFSALLVDDHDTRPESLAA